MKKYLIAFQTQREDDRKFLIKIIKKLGNWATYIDGTAILKTDKSIDEVKDFILPLKSGDNMLIFDITKSEFTGWMPGDFWKRLKDEKSEKDESKKIIDIIRKNIEELNRLGLVEMTYNSVVEAEHQLDNGKIDGGKSIENPH